MGQYIIDKTDQGYVLKFYVNKKPIHAFHVKRKIQAIELVQQLQYPLNETDGYLKGVY